MKKKPEPKPIDTRLSAAFGYYLMAIPLSASSRRSYSAVIKRLKDAKLWGTTIEDFTPAKFRAFLNNLDVADSTRYLVYYVKVLGVITAYVRDHNLTIPISNLKRLIKPPPHKEELEGEESYLTMAEVVSLGEIDLSEQPEIAYGRELFLLMVYTGMAVSDLVRLDPRKNISTDGKWFQYKRKKNGKLCKVPMLPFLTQLIERNQWPVHIRERMIAYHCEPLSDLVGRKITCHSGRKSFGCIMLHLGFSMASVSKMMGHSSISTTEKHYAKVYQEKIESEMLEIPERLLKMMNP